MSGISLSLLGRGAVTPNGWAMPEGAPAGGLSLASGITRTDERVPVRRVEETGSLWDRWKREPRLRRASPIARFIAEAVNQAMAGAVPGKKRGLIGVFSTGTLTFSRKFYEGYTVQGRGLASPALFPETVYNSPLSHAAAIFGFDGPCSSLIGDESAWADACATAWLWVELGQAEEVVVVAAEELDPVGLEAFRAAGWLKAASGYVPSEGAGAVRLGSVNQAHAGSGAGGAPVLRVLQESLPFGGRVQARAAAERLVGRVPKGGQVLPTAFGTWWARHEAAALGVLVPVPPPAGFITTGRAFAAHSAWATLAAAEIASTGESVYLPLWGLNFGTALLQIESSAAELAR